ncbi:MAG TPA: amidohydrolase family protein [Terriglobales bacterium]|nr:amidohydrolase family protein [Terriglobales bacterium]
MNRKPSYLAALTVACALGLAAQAPQPKPVAIVGARIVPVSGADIAVGTVVFAGGKITALGVHADVPRGATIIPGKGLSVYPGMMDDSTTLGIAEVTGAAPGTVDTNELGTFNPQLISSKSVNPTSDIIGTVRANGVTTALVSMRGGVIPAQASVVDLGLYTNDEMSVERETALWINFPSASGGGRGGRGGAAPAPNANPLRELNDYLDAARRYAAVSQPDGDPRPAMAAMKPYVTGQKPVIVSVTTAADIRAALRWGREQHLKLILAGARDAWETIPEIKAAGVPVLYGPVTAMPGSENDPYDAVYSTPGELAKAGIPFALITGSAADSRNLPYNAALAEAYGLASDAALRAITLSPAEILGLDHDLGSLAMGKRANLVVTTGDPLDPRTQIKQVYVDGLLMPESKHQRLYEQWLARPDGK